MKLNKKQLEMLNTITESIKALHIESEEDDPYMAEGRDTVLIEVEELLFDLGKIDKKIF